MYSFQDNIKAIFIQSKDTCQTIKQGTLIMSIKVEQQFKFCSLFLFHSFKIVVTVTVISPENFHFQEDSTFAPELSRSWQIFWKFWEKLYKNFLRYFNRHPNWWNVSRHEKPQEKTEHTEIRSEHGFWIFGKTITLRQLLNHSTTRWNHGNYEEWEWTIRRFVFISW